MLNYSVYSLHSVHRHLHSLHYFISQILFMIIYCQTKHQTLIDLSVEEVAILLLPSPRKRQCVSPCTSGEVADDTDL